MSQYADPKRSLNSGFVGSSFVNRQNDDAVALDSATPVTLVGSEVITATDRHNDRSASVFQFQRFEQDALTEVLHAKLLSEIASDENFGSTDELTAMAN